MKFQLSPAPAALPHSRKKLPATGDLCCCPALSSELGLMLLTAQVVRGSVGLDFVTLVVHPLAAPSEGRRRATFRRILGVQVGLLLRRGGSNLADCYSRSLAILFSDSGLQPAKTSATRPFLSTRIDRGTNAWSPP